MPTWTCSSGSLTPLTPQLLAFHLLSVSQTWLCWYFMHSTLSCAWSLSPGIVFQGSLTLELLSCCHKSCAIWATLHLPVGPPLFVLCGRRAGLCSEPWNTDFSLFEVFWSEVSHLKVNNSVAFSPPTCSCSGFIWTCLQLFQTHIWREWWLGRTVTL